MYGVKRTELSKELSEKRNVLRCCGKSAFSSVLYSFI